MRLPPLQCGFQELHFFHPEITPHKVLESKPAQLTFQSVHPRPNLIRSQLEPQTIHKSIDLVVTLKNEDKALGGHIHKLKFFIHSGGQEKIPQCWKWSTMITIQSYLPSAALCYPPQELTVPISTWERRRSIKKHEWAIWGGACWHFLVFLFHKSLHEKASAVRLLHCNDDSVFPERKVQVSAALAILSLASLVFHNSYKY